MTYQAIPPASSASSGSMSAAFTRAQTLLGAAGVTKVFGSEFENDQWYRTSLATGGVVTPTTTERGGAITVDSSATAGSAARILPSGTIVELANPRTDLWYIAVRAKLNTAVDANGVMQTIRLSTTALGSPTVFLGAFGPTSITHYSWGLTDNAGATTGGAATTVALDTAAYHLFEVWNNGTTISFAIDGVVVATSASTNVGTNPVTPAVAVANGATPASRSVTVDYLWMCTGNP